MNKSYKVVFSKARGALMAVNEATSSVQAKGTKTVIAAAVAALVAGAAMAETDATGWEVVDGLTNAAITTTVSTSDDSPQYISVGEQGTTIQEGGHLTISNGKNYGVNWSDRGNVKAVLHLNGGKLTIDNAGVQVNTIKITSGSATIGGTQHIDDAGRYSWDDATLGAYSGDFLVSGGDLTLKKGARLWLGGDEDSQSAIEFQGGSLSIDAAEGAAVIGTLLPAMGDCTTCSQQIHFGGTSVDVKAGRAILLAPTVVLDAGTVTIAQDATLTVASKKAQETVSGVKYFTPVEADGLFTVAASLINNGTLEVLVNNLTVENGGTLENTGKLTAKTVNINEGGLVNTTASGFAADATVNEGGAFNLTALNSNFNASLGNQAPADSDTTTKDSYLLLNNLVLNGGSLTYNNSALDKIKVGSQGTTGNLQIQKGSYSFGSMLFGGMGKATVDAGASLTINNLYLTNYDARLTNNGTLTIGTVTMAKGTDGNVIVPTAGAQEDLIVNTGAIYTAASNVLNFTKDKDGKITDAAETAFGSVLFDNTDSGKVYDDTITSITLSEYGAIFGTGDAWVGHLILTNATVQSDSEDGTIGFEDLTAGGSLGNTVVTSSSNTAAPVSDVTVAAVAFTGDGASGNVTIGDSTNGNVLGLTGKDGAFFTGVAADKTVTFTGTVNLGDSQSTAQNAIVNDVIVASGGNLGIEGNISAKNITLSSEAQNQSFLNIENGVLEADSIKGGIVNVAGGAVLVKGQAPTAVNALAASYDAAFKVESTYFVAGSDDQVGFLYFGEGSNSVIEPTVSAARDAYGDDINTVMLVDQHLDLVSSNGMIRLGTKGKVDQFGEIKTDGSSVVVLDLKGIANHNYNPEEGIFTSTDDSTLAKVVLTNLDRNAFTANEDGTFTLDVGAKVNNVRYDGDFYEVTHDKGDETVTIAADEDALAELTNAGIYVSGEVAQAVRTMTPGNALVNAIVNGNAANDAYREAVDAKLAEFDKLISQASTQAEKDALTAQKNAYDTAADEYKNRSVNAAANMAVESGAFSTAVDVNDQVMNALARRTSLASLNVSRAQSGFTPWVDVIGSSNEAKGLYGNAGYEADIYGAVLGFDYTASCGGVLGVAFNIGTADANSVDNDVKSDADTDFYGVSLYASKQMGLVNVQAALGYQQTSNDLSTSGAFGQWKESLDADLFTFGLGAEYLAKAGAVNVVPHAAIRWTRIDMDDSKFGADYDTMNLWQMPIGVAFSGEFEAAGMKLSPMFDLSVVPTFGDKDATAKFVENTIDTRVVDSNPVRATLGLNGQVDAWTFGVNYGLSAGSDERLNNSFNVNARYTF